MKLYSKSVVINITAYGIELKLVEGKCIRAFSWFWFQFSSIFFSEIFPRRIQPGEKSKKEKMVGHEGRFFAYSQFAFFYDGSDNSCSACDSWRRCSNGKLEASSEFIPALDFQIVNTNSSNLCSQGHCQQFSRRCVFLNP